MGLRADGLPDIDWVPVKGGEVTIEIRSNQNDPNSAVVKRLTRAVEPFWMARYPVTVTQLQAFLADCHRDGTWRLVNLPADYRPPKHRARHGNHPADSVNWWDALAFCHWLSTRFGFEVRLPTEYEWQLAATGGESACTYPWGPDWDPQMETWRANTDESALGRSTAVGMYPAGASPAGVQDMAGTIWEWCQDRFEHSDDKGRSWLRSMFTKRQQQEDSRVLRGGSWRGDQVNALPELPDRRRRLSVLCSSPILEH